MLGEAQEDQKKRPEEENKACGSAEKIKVLISRESVSSRYASLISGVPRFLPGLCVTPNQLINL